MPLHQIGVRQFRVWPTDLDIFRHMNNGVFLTLMDVARFDMLKRTGAWKAAKRANIYPIVVGETITFRKSLTLGQTFNIETGVIGWDDVAFFVKQRFVVNGEVFVEAVGRLRFLKNPKGTPTPDEVLEVFGGWQGPVPKLPDWVLAWDKSVALPKGREAAPSEWNQREVV
jgi:acyl-CoA thioesterase FadM